MAALQSISSSKKVKMKKRKREREKELYFVEDKQGVAE